MSVSTDATTGEPLPIIAPEEVMAQKEHGTCTGPPQEDLRWGCSFETADNICCFNRHYAEYSGYWLKTKFLEEVTSTLSLTPTNPQP
mmetsp:Transcript_2019/g.6060  ORF Transcript_2019/g.6060 Transcript_2019/m.6060 type:complete len:87 (-) Transcript_2019:28-288(-)